MYQFKICIFSEKMTTFLLYLNENFEQKYEHLKGLNGL